jgi:hypothetical protein
MKCYYCSFFHDAEIRNGNGQHFCRSVTSMVSSDDDSCEKFELTSTYRCLSLSFCTDIKICTARLNKEMEDCRKCRQRKDILEIRRFLGRKVIQSRPKILIRRETPCQEKTATL